MNILDQILEQMYKSKEDFMWEMTKDLGLNDRRGRAPRGAYDKKDEPVVQQPAAAPPERTLMERELAGENVYGSPRQYHFGTGGGAFGVDTGYAAPNTETTGEIRGRNQQAILDMFKKMNPDLDYDAVARQSGGNVPGGSFSAVERKNVPKAQTDEEFIRWVNEDLPKYTASSMLDSRSREYNPEAAKIIFDRLAQERGDAAQMLYSRGQELRGQADLDKVQMLKRQAEFSRTPQGQMQSTIDFVLQNVDPALNADVFDKAIRARMALMNGQVEEAQRILQSIADTTDATQVANKTGQPVVG